MTAPSWMLLEREDPAWALPADLAARDARGAADVGWADQMRPFIEAFTEPGDVVLDPFAGLGTTLVAAASMGREAWGVELDPARTPLAEERLARLCLGARLHVGDAAALPVQDASVDLVLTNVPYFEAGDGDTAQLYAAPTVAAYRQRLRPVVAEMARVLRPGGVAVCMVQNVTRGGVLVPLASAWTEALAERLTLREERILLYRRAREASGDDPFATDRSHEHALIAQRPLAPEAGPASARR